MKTAAFAIVAYIIGLALVAGLVSQSQFMVQAYHHGGL